MPRSNTSGHSVATNTFAELLINTGGTDFLDDVEQQLSQNDEVFIVENKIAWREGISQTGSAVPEYSSAVYGSDGSMILKFGESSRNIEDEYKVSIPVIGSYGRQNMEVTRRSHWLLFDRYDIEGAGLLSFSVITGIFSFLVKDDYKSLFKITKVAFPHFCTCFLFCLSSSNMPIVNMDGSSNGSITYSKFPNSPFPGMKVCRVRFVRNLDPKAKYMQLSAALVPYLTYYHTSFRKKQTYWIMFLYFFFILILALLAIALQHNISPRIRNISSFAAMKSKIANWISGSSTTSN